MFCRKNIPDKPVVLRNFRVLDEEIDIKGAIIIENGFISALLLGNLPLEQVNGAAVVIDGEALAASGALPVLMPAFVDLHAHFRDPGLPDNNTALLSEVVLPSEVLESGAMAAAAGGFGTVVCMANTKPATDSLKKILNLKKRSDALGLIDLYPVMSLTKGMEGKELSEITVLKAADPLCPDPDNFLPLMLSEDGKDLADEDLFLAAMREAKRLGIPVSCHCDFGGDETNAVRRVIELGKKAACHIHIAHVSTRGAVEVIALAKAEGLALSCEVMPHNLCLTEEDARKLGEKTHGRVNPPLRSEEDRKALIRALGDGTLDAIATDHAPHSQADKEAGAPGFSGFETAFAAVYTELVRNEIIDLKKLSSLMSAKPAELLGFGKGSQKRGRLLPGYRADFVIADTEAPWIVNPAEFKTRGKNSAFAGRELYGKILMTFHAGQVVFISG
jgi:dihydroorotase